MPATDTEQIIREAVVSILVASAPVQTAIGRATEKVWQRSPSIGVEVPLPVLLYDLVSFDDASGNSRLILTALVDGGNATTADAAAKCREILKAGVGALDYPAFAALGLEVIPYPENRQSVENDPDAPGSINREGQPLLQQADALVPLLYLP